jgi:hypothetical protein
MVEMSEREIWQPSEMQNVYCFQLGSDDCFKIGRTKNSPDERKNGFSTVSPAKLRLYRTIETEYAPELEKCIHQLLDEKRAENGEVFHVAAVDLDDAVDRSVAFIEKSQPFVREASRLRRQRLLKAMSVQPSGEMFHIYRELRAYRREKFFIEQRISFLESQIQVAIGDNWGMEGIASWTWTDRWTVDTERFKKEQESLYEQYKRNSGSRRFHLETIDLTKTL